MFVPVLPFFFVFLVLLLLCHEHTGTIRSAEPRQPLALLVACRDPRSSPWPAVVPLATCDPHIATATNRAQSHPCCPSWMVKDPVCLLSHLRAGLVLLGMPGTGTRTDPVQATDVPATSCPQWTRGQVSKVRHSATAQNTQQEETQRKKRSCFHTAQPPQAAKRVRTLGEPVIGAACLQHSRFAPASYTDHMWWQLTHGHQQTASDHHGYNLLSFPKEGQNEYPDTGD